MKNDGDARALPRRPDRADCEGVKKDFCLLLNVTVHWSPD